MKKRTVLPAALTLLGLAAYGRKESVESKTVKNKTMESGTTQGYRDGTYSREAEVREVGGTIKFGITVSGGKIATVGVQSLDHESREKSKDYGRNEPLNRGFYNIARNSIPGTDKFPGLFVDSQNPDSIDAVNGATFSHEASVQAAKTALDGVK